MGYLQPYEADLIFIYIYGTILRSNGNLILIFLCSFLIGVEGFILLQFLIVFIFHSTELIQGVLVCNRLGIIYPSLIGLEDTQVAVVNVEVGIQFLNIGIRLRL
jgi:hypothetical protein